MYLHDAILEGVTSGATEVQVDRLGQKFAELEKVDAEGESGFLKEYSVRTICYLMRLTNDIVLYWYGTCAVIRCSEPLMTKCNYR